MVVREKNCYYAIALTDFFVFLSCAEQSITEMAHRLSIGVLAEGVDSQAEIEYLQQLGCDYVQGYGFSKPMSSQQTTQWLMQRFTQV